MSSTRERLTEILLENGLVSKEHLDEALTVQQQKKGRLADILFKLGHISEEKKFEVLTAEIDVPAIRLSRYKVQFDVIALIPKKSAERYLVIPISKFENTLTLAMVDPMNLNTIDDIGRMTGLQIRPLLASEKEVLSALGKYYKEASAQAPAEDASREKAVTQKAPAKSFETSVKELLHLTNEQPVVKLTNSILAEGVRLRSSDIFIEPEENNLRVRFRVDGLLQEGLMTTRQMHSGVVSRIKVMSNLDIAEHRIPQDGRFRVAVGEKDVDFRISVLPTYFGEKVVLRILDKQQAVLDVNKLGFEPKPLDDLKRASLKPHGMIVICGPTGSGKTTTLYSALKLIDDPEKNIVTVEDPVEFQLPGINQVPIRAEVKLTFAAALRSILRQDPDVIMVGEIRDSETADIAVKAALTGHLVLSTLHATTAVGAVTRLLNMGIEPFLITSSLILTGSQRLVRKICPKCKESYKPSKELLDELDVKDAARNKDLVFCRGKGCEECGMKGYSGRAVLLETVPLTPSFKNLILKGSQEYQLKEAARREGMLTLRENGIAKVLQGVTTPDEVLRVTVKDSA